MNIRDLIPWGHGRREPWSRSRQEVATRRDDIDPMRALQLDINRVFDNFWRSFELPMLGTGNGGAGSGLVPQVDVRETDKEVEVIAELPGMNEADVDVNLGFDAQTGEYRDLVKAGIIDPTKVVRTALQEAASIASLLITTEAMIAQKPEPPPPAPAAPPGDMGF